MKKYELTTNTKVFDGKTLYQMRALASFGDVHAGDFGGYIEKEDKSFEKISKYNYVRAEAFVMGKQVCAIEDTGFSNVDQVMDKLVTILPKNIHNARVQFKITNVDKNLTQMYQRLIP